MEQLVYAKQPELRRTPQEALEVVAAWVLEVPLLFLKFRVSMPCVCTFVHNFPHQAWNEIELSTITRAFKKCCITNDLDGSEDHLAYEDSSESDEDEEDTEDEEEDEEEEDEQEGDGKDGANTSHFAEMLYGIV